MKRMLIVCVALGMGVVACSKKQPKAGAQAVSAAIPGGSDVTKVAAKDGVMSAEAMWAVAQQDDSAMRKSFTLTGRVSDVDIDTGVYKLSVSVSAPGSEDEIDMYFASPAGLDPLGKPGSFATATCNLVGVTPHKVRMEGCQLK